MNEYVQELAFDIYCIDIEYIRPRLACSYLIVHEGKAAFIDCGTSHSVSKLLSVVNTLGLCVSDIEYVIPTHIHLDHAGGAGKLMQQLPNAQLIVHPLGARHLIDPQRLIDSAKHVYGDKKFNSLYGEIAPIDEHRIITAGENETISLNGRALLFADTPGHARHHFCIYDELSNGWFTGDTFGLSYPDITLEKGRYLMPTTTPVQFEPDAWLDSLKKLLDKNPQRMYLTHFGSVENIKELALKLKHDIQYYSQIALSTPHSDSRVKELSEKLKEFTINDISMLTCSLDNERILELLKTDIELNAQGLDVWLKRKEKQQQTSS